MKKKVFLTVTVAVLFLLCLATVASAVGDGRQARRKAPRGRDPNRRQMNRFFNRVDTDNSGAISLREFFAFINGRAENTTIRRVFNAADKDGSGELSIRELVNGVRFIKKAQRPKMQQRFDQVDQDGSGAISLREFFVFINGRAENATIRRVFNAADKDDSGELSIRELVNGIRLMKKAHRSKMQARFDRVDRDGSGAITLREFFTFINGRAGDDIIRRVFNAADKNGDEQLSNREFVHGIRLIRKANA